MNFEDTQLQQCYERNLSEAPGSTGALRQVGALIATHGLFQMLEGPHSERVHETIAVLLLPELRSGLRSWYQRADAGTDSAATGLRDQLSQLVGEKLEDSGELRGGTS